MARVVVDVMLKPEILDPQGQAVAGALPRLGVTNVSSVRIGRRSLVRPRRRDLQGGMARRRDRRRLRRARRLRVVR